MRYYNNCVATTGKDITNEEAVIFQIKLRQRKHALRAAAG